MTPEIFIKRQLNATFVERVESIQSLWSGYGDIARYRVYLNDTSYQTVILKHVSLPETVIHPRGWQSDHAHQRKVRSYDVEVAWYRDWVGLCNEHCRVATCHGVLSSPQEDSTVREGDFSSKEANQQFILLEDLDASGYGKRHGRLTASECLPCLSWLAAFHGLFLQHFPIEQGPASLWQRGSYWHLATRQDEWHAMVDSELKRCAKQIDSRLDQAQYKTLVHGDAKVANFCFSDDGRDVAAVDFQYVGAGIGVQDVAYFLGSVLSEEELEGDLPYLLEHYFAELGQAIVAKGESQALATAVIEEWQGLFAMAWADFHRFILGWSPTHPKNTPFSQQLTEQALRQLR